MARARPFRLQGGFRLLVGRDIHELEETQKLIIKTLAWGLAFTIVVALIGGIAMSRSTMRRIEAINETSREIISGDLSRRIPTRNTGDDFDQLTDNLNTMLDQIESLMEDVRRVSDNIAHDLRTPLARLRSRLEIARMNQTDSESNKHMIEQAVQEADGLLSTFNSLLRIARIESDSHRANFTNVAMNTLVEDVAELYEPLAEEKNQRLETTSSGGFNFHADRDLLFQAIANLVDNAIKYTASGGSIKMTLGQNTGNWQLSVEDSGPGIPASARERVFQRFFRLESSRTTPGNGLGLSLVGAVANLHDIGIRLEDNNPGLRVILTFSQNTGI
jgi:signal transduction histidine kinase